jgi:hypothetical protein
MNNLHSACDLQLDQGKAGRETTMAWFSRCGVAGLLLCTAGLAGCWSKAAAPKKEMPEHVAAAAARTAAAPSRQPERVARPTARDPALATYSNPEYGVAFRYPRSFPLQEEAISADREAAHEDAPENRPGVRSQEELESEEPGAVLVASVVVPDDAYPNTSFAGGSLQFAVNRYQTAGTCRQNLISRLGDSNARSGIGTIQGVDFAWADKDEGDGSAEYFERDYAGFTNGTCYEFFLRVGVVATSDADTTRPPDEKKILANLEKIVSSLQFESKGVSALDGPTSAQATRRRR